MKAITILQPWASLIACGEKKIETRSWATKYRGKIAIHAAAKHTRLQFENPYHDVLGKHYNLHVPYDMDEIPYGKVIAIADLVNCVIMDGLNFSVEDKVNGAYLANGDFVEGNELAFGDYAEGRYAWILENVQRVEPVPAKGQQRIWNWNIPDDYFVENFYQGGVKKMSKEGNEHGKGSE